MGGRQSTLTVAGSPMFQRLFRRPDRRAILWLESLEDRTVPSTTLPPVGGGTAPAAPRGGGSTSRAPTIVLSPSKLSAATVDVSYSQKLSASGGTAPYTFSVSK